MEANLMYALRDVPGKGKGVVAIQDIPRGTRILSEQPVITVPECQSPGNNESVKEHISKQAQSLGDQQRQSLLSMHNIYPYSNLAERYLGICRTNGLPMSYGGIGGGIFLEACRINHSCEPNAQKDWNDQIKRHTVHALRDIPEGEEITIYYLGRDSSRSIRQQRLQENFGFQCSCRLCSLPEEQSRESDRRLARIEELDGLIGREGMYMNFSIQMLRYVDEQVRLYNEQGPGNVGLPRAYIDAAQIAFSNGDFARGRTFAERAVEGWRTALGSDSKSVKTFEPMTRNPPVSQVYPRSMRWKTSADEVPKGLSPDDFEDWLWRREKGKTEKLTEPRQQIHELRDLRNQDVFPSFNGLDVYRETELNNENDGGAATSSHRSKYFLGEIMDSTAIHHFEINLMAIDGKEVPLHFYTKDLGFKWASSPQIQKGYTVAVRDAKRKTFVHGHPGIKLEDDSLLKIFPLSLGKLLELNDRVQLYSKKSSLDKCRVCHECGKHGTSMRKCARCEFFWYCDKNCQRSAWSDRGHKADCKLLKDPGLRELFCG